MPRRTLLWQLIGSFCLILLVGLTLVTSFSLHTIRDLHERQSAQALTSSARLIIPQIEAAIAKADWGSIQGIVRHCGEETGTRFTVILSDGSVVLDSEEDPAFMDDHGSRPEIVKALESGLGVSTRFSATMQKTMMYAAVSSGDTESGKVVIRASRPLADLQKEIGRLIFRVTFVGVAVGFIAILIGIWLARKISRPVESMTRAAHRFARGEFQDKIPVPHGTELAQLSLAMNLMADELNSRLELIEQQTREKEAIFTSMDEGVLAIDRDGLLISVNRAAAGMLGIDAREARKRNILEVIRSTNLKEFIERTQKSPDTITGEISLMARPESQIQTRGTALRNEQGESMGVLVVLHDITQLRRLEQIRKEFVANVSHELKTPVTAIRGFVETLLEEDQPDLETRKRFLEIINRQVRRLSTIIEDLLSLSRIERQQDEPLHREPMMTAGIILGALEVCQSAAEQKGITITHQIDAPESVQMNGPMIEQAVVNLVDNAIKYSPDNTPVNVDVRQDAGDLLISVADKGIGIAQEHHERLFERFYRVDKGRSRQVGGTGLGLAIVKHIAITHGGSVEVESTIGQGTTFSLRIPLNPAAVS